MYDLLSIVVASNHHFEFLSLGPGASDQRSSSPDAEDSRRGESPRGRVLIVEDETFAVLYMADIVTEGGFDVVATAATAEEAIAKAGTENPDLVIMDIRLIGERDGVYAATEIMQRHGIRSLFVSAYSDPQTRHRASVCSPAGFVEKPFTPETLLSALRAAL